MQEVALGYLGWTEEQFWDSTPRTFTNAYRGWAKQKEILQRGDWERVRQLAYTLVQVQSKKRLKPTDIMAFEWDKKDIKRAKYGT
jgi:hypothetical protein